MLRTTALKSWGWLLNRFSCDDLAKLAKPEAFGTQRWGISSPFCLPLTLQQVCVSVITIEFDTIIAKLQRLQCENLNAGSQGCLLTLKIQRVLVRPPTPLSRPSSQGKPDSLLWLGNMVFSIPAFHFWPHLLPACFSLPQSTRALVFSPSYPTTAMEKKLPTFLYPEIQILVHL